MKWKGFFVIVACLLLAAGFSLSAESLARVEYVEGDVLRYSASDGATMAAGIGDTLGQGDGLILADRATASVFFDDGSRLDLSGPTHVRFRLIADYARTVELLYGTINRLRVDGVTTGVITPADVFAVVTTGDLFMRAEMTSEPQRTTIWLREGQNGVCGQASRSQPLVVGKPVVFLTTHCCPRPPALPIAPAVPGGPLGFPLTSGMLQGGVGGSGLFDDPVDDPGDTSYIGRLPD